MFTLNYRAHLSIDELSIKKWDKISKKNTLLPLVKRGIPPNNLLDIWYDLQDQYTERYGITPEYKEYIELVKKATILKSTFVETDQRYLLNEINILDTDIEAKQAQTHPLDLKKAIPMMSKYYGYNISDDISVVEFFDKLNAMNHG